MSDLPKTQYAVQLVGPNEPVLNKQKEVMRPGPHQITCRVEAVGLCFSDLKLLKQFSTHARKTEITGGIDPAILKEIPSYMPGDMPTVPGHEAVVRVAEVGPDVDKFNAGDRFLVQTDYRWLPTADSNASFGYNFEGALQEYVLMDERIITSPEGESLLIPVPDDLSASAVALVEPWACVEDAYACKERQRIKAGGRMLIVADIDVGVEPITGLFVRYGKPESVVWVGKAAGSQLAGVAVKTAASMAEVADASFDDAVYFGSDADEAAAIFPKVGPKGLFNIVQCGGKFGKNVVTQVGRVHYGGIRIIGTAGSDPAEAMEHIPATGELRRGDKVQVVGAAGPMGLMHVVRDICQGIEGVSICAGDLDDDRLAVLARIVEPIAQKNGAACRIYNPSKESIDEQFDYIALMAPVPQLVAGAVKTGAENAIINVFAGIPATVSGEIDLDRYIEKHMYFIGTSGSVLEDMRTVLAKVVSGRLDTNVSVAAVSGLDGACDGIRAVENRTLSGKIVVYPSCKGLGLTPLEELAGSYPEVSESLNDGLWTRQAENKLVVRF